MNRLTTKMLKDWMTSDLLASFKSVGVQTGRIPDNPDRCVLIQQAGAGTDIYEGIYEQRGYRFTCRGKSNSQNDAEEIANWINDYMDGLANFDIEEVTILSMSARGKPRPLSITDSQSRFQVIVEIDIISSQD